MAGARGALRNAHERDARTPRIERVQANTMRTLRWCIVDMALQGNSSAHARCQWSCMRERGGGISEAKARTTATALYECRECSSARVQQRARGALCDWGASDSVSDVNSAMQCQCLQSAPRVGGGRPPPSSWVVSLCTCSIRGPQGRRSRDFARLETWPESDLGIPRSPSTNLAPKSKKYK